VGRFAILPTISVSFVLLLGACSSSSRTATVTQSTAASASSASATAVASTVAATTTAPATTPAVTAAPTTTAAAATTTATPAVGSATSVACPSGAPAGFICLSVKVPLDPTDPAGAKISLAVTARRTNPAAWTSPVLVFGGPSVLNHLPANWTNTPPSAAVLTGHDLVYIDPRGTGHSDGAVPCPELLKIAGQMNTTNFSTAAAAVVKACYAKTASALVPIASMLDNDVAAADLIAARKALGIDSWAVAAQGASADVTVRMVKADPKAITAMVVRSPMAVGAGRSPNTISEAFDRFAADCAASATCAKTGELNALLAKAAKLPPVTTKVTDVDGSLIILDVGSLQIGLQSALGTPQLAPLMPQMLAGAGDDAANDALANAYVNGPPGSVPEDAAELAGACQDVDYFYPGLKTTAADHGGVFVGTSLKRLCDILGPVPQLTPLPKVTSDVPVLVLLPSYHSGSSVVVSKAIFAGFPNLTIVEIPGVSDASQVPCFNQVRTAFVENPTVKADLSCLTAPSFKTFP
jgi:pimeloyl-ACP methyl ester carboxylesterase